MVDKRAEGSTLARGNRLGPYEIVELLGSGGMSDVYRARDPRIGRDVAIKVLRGSGINAADVAAVTREARAAGSLNHPNILAVYDVATEGDIPYVVEELLEGETLRARLDRGVMPFRKAVDYAIQIAQALDSAHARGIWHRDVKPANVFVTKDGHVKLLDFGLAKITDTLPTDSTADLTDESHTGRVVGTAGYMSPEQVRGMPTDHRTDIFALGSMLYEMFTGARAFKRATTVETMNAILTEEPIDPVALNAALPAAAAAVVRRCLEKDREERFQSARDLVFALKQLRDPSTASLTPRPAQRRVPTFAIAIAAAALIVAAVAVAALLVRPDATPVFEQLTFHRGRIGGARFASDGRAVVYSGTRNANTLEVWRIDLADSPQSRPLSYPASSDVLAVRAGEFALSVRRNFLMGERFVGTLALAPAGGGSPREVTENVEDADWDPTGTHLATVRSTGEAGGQSWIEYDGKTLHTTAGSIRFLRVSRDGQRIAFLEDPTRRGSSGSVVMLELRSGAITRLTENWDNARGLAWSPRGDEVWFTAAQPGLNRVLRAVNLAREQRVVFEAPGSLTVWDVSGDGRALLTRDEQRRSIVGVPPGETTERDFSSFDESGLADLSADGRWILFKDRFGVFLRETVGPQLTNLGLTDAFPDQISPDGRMVLATIPSPPQLILIPTGPGNPRGLPSHNITGYSGAFWFPDSQQIFFSGSTPGRALRSYVQDISGGAPRELTPEGTRALSISPDGQLVAAIGPDDGISLWPVAGGASRHVPGSQRGDRPVAWSADGRWLWLFRRGEVPTHVDRLEIATGRREVWKRLLPLDDSGVYSIIEFRVTPTGHSYFYSYTRLLSQLFLVNGLE
jgi:WD40 repeat protein